MSRPDAQCLAALDRYVKALVARSRRNYEHWLTNSSPAGEALPAPPRDEQPGEGE